MFIKLWLLFFFYLCVYFSKLYITELNPNLTIKNTLFPAKTKKMQQKSQVRYTFSILIIFIIVVFTKDQNLQLWSSHIGGECQFEEKY